MQGREEPVMKKLSEAMRQGAIRTMSVTDQYFAPDPEDEMSIAYTCAVGAMLFTTLMDRLGHAPNVDEYRAISRRGTCRYLREQGYPDLCGVFVVRTQWPKDFADLQVAGGLDPSDDNTETLWHIIIKLNDNLGWSRERIADWLESIGY
jgi:hypothetical protein